MVAVRALPILVSLSLLLPATAAAQSASFTDVPASHPTFQAVEYLKVKGVLQGYADGTFKPDAKVNRAEALKIIVAPVVPEGGLSATTSVYSDVPAGSWYLPYAEAARQIFGIIDGPPKTTTFAPTRNVNKAEFIKMTLLAQRIDPMSALSELRGGLATDVASSSEWFYPYIRFAVASSMTMVDETGALNPGQELTRGQVAIFLYRLDMFLQGRRTQALLSEAETEIVNVLQLFEQRDILNAEYAANRSIVAARGALLSAPDEGVVKGAVKVAEGFQVLVQGYKAGVEGRLDDVISLSGTAWHLATKAQEFSPHLVDIVAQMQAIAKGMADEARALKAAQPTAQ